MGKSKLKKFAELETFGNVVQVPFRSVDQSDYKYKGKWNAEFFKNKNPLILELGCGKGEYTVSLAKLMPGKNFIGVDIKGARIWKGAKAALENGIHNAGFLRTSIDIIDKFFGEKEIEQIWLTFPDPQMKNSRKRLTATNFMEKYRRMLNENGIIHLKTDSNFQYRYTLEMIKENGLNIIAQTDNLYHSSLLNDALSIQTFYEKQWRDRDIPIKYLAFQLNSKDILREPAIEIEKDTYRSFGRFARE